MEPLTLAESRRALDQGKLDPVELLELCLARIDRTEPTIKAWILIDRDGATKAARQVKPGDGGPLAGIPLGIKDIIDVAGMPTTAASKVLAGAAPAKEDAPVVRRLRDAGAVILGKTNLQEFAYGYVTTPTTNPWDSSRIPGGSSGGTAAAVAAGHCYGGLGTDTGGSIRVPAALCGISGLKPGFGVLPIEGIVPLAPSLDVVGPMARSVEDLVLMSEALSLPVTETESALKVGVGADSALPEMDEAVASAFAEATDLIGAKLAPLIELEVPRFEDFDIPRAAMLLPEALEVHRSQGWWPEHSDSYRDETRSYLRFAETLMPAEMVEAGLSEAKKQISALSEALDQVDVLLTPASPVLPPTHEEAAKVEEGGLRRPVAMTLGRLPGPVNMVGCSALAIPMRPTPEGLPTSLQIMGKRTEAVMELGRRFQRETDWHRRVPQADSQL